GEELQAAYVGRQTRDPLTERRTQGVAIDQTEKRPFRIEIRNDDARADLRAVRQTDAGGGAPIGDDSLDPVVYEVLASGTRRGLGDEVGEATESAAPVPVRWLFSRFLVRFVNRAVPKAQRQGIPPNGRHLGGVVLLQDVGWQELGMEVRNPFLEG